MAVLLPPTPVGVPPGHSFWNDWYERLRLIINDGSVSVTWNNINFTGSNITDIAVRAHNSLQSLQGGTSGQYYHLTAAQYASLGAGDHNDLNGIQGGAAAQRYHLSLPQYNRATTMISAASDPTTSTLSAGEWGIYKNTSTDEVKLWVNDGGVMKSVQLT